MPLSPQEAASRVNEQVMVEMLVKAAKNCPHCSQIFLDSEEDHHDPNNLANQNGIVFFPGAVPLYKDVTGRGQALLVGGLGVSGDGVDQDDVVTFAASQGYTPPPNILTADQTFVRGVRLPYQKFNRNPQG